MDVELALVLAEEIQDKGYVVAQQRERAWPHVKGGNGLGRSPRTLVLKN